MQILDRQNNTINGICSSCGKCCANVLMLTPQEIKRINEYIIKNNIKAVNRNTIFNFVNICPFLNQENQCNIYNVRPDICKKFSCDKNISEDLSDYTNVKAIDMFATFYPNEFSEKTDLTEINQRIRILQKKIKKGG